MNKEEIKELQEKTYAISWSGFPLDAFFNDIRDNPNPNFDKDSAYQDLKKIVDEIYKLKDKAKKYDELVKPKIYKYKAILSLSISSFTRLISTLPDGYKEIRTEWNFETNQWEDIIIYDRELTKEEMNKHRFLYVLRKLDVKDAM